MARDFVADGSYGIQVKGKRAFVEESQGGSWAVLKSALVPMSSSQAQRWIDYYIPGASGPSQARILGHLTGGKKNPAKSLTLRNMAVVTVKRLPGGAVAITGRKLNPGKLGSQGIDFRASRIRFSSWYATKKEALRAIPRLKETFRRDTGGKELRSPKVEKDPRGGYIITRLTSQGARRKR